MIYLTLPELLHVAERTLGPGYAVRDYGLLEAALARPRATAFGKDAYPTSTPRPQWPVRERDCYTGPVRCALGAQWWSAG